MNKLEIIKKISENLTSIKLPDNLSFERVNSWTFPDKHVEEVKRNNIRMFVLRDETKQIGVIKFGVFYKNNQDIIEIDFIQGAKKANPSIKYPKGWPEIMVSSFILSCLPILEKNPLYKISYFEIELLKYSSSNLMNKKQKILFVHAIRNRFFDKEGYLNTNRERVKKIFEVYKIHQQNQNLKKTSILKRSRTPKKIIKPKKHGRR